MTVDQLIIELCKVDCKQQVRIALPTQPDGLDIRDIESTMPMQNKHDDEDKCMLIFAVCQE